MWKVIASIVGVLGPIVFSWLITTSLKPLEDDVQKLGGGVVTVLGNFFDDPSNVLWMAYTGMIFIGMLYGYAFARLMRWMDERPSKSFKALEGKLFSARCAAEFLREGNFDQAAAVDRLGLIETSLLLLEDLGFKTPYELPWQVILGTEKGRDLLFVYFASLAAYAEEGRVVEAKQLSKDFTQQASTMDFS